MLAAVGELLALLPAPPDRPQRFDVLAHARRRRAPRHAEPVLVVGADLRSQAENEAPSRGDLEVPARVRHWHRTPRERDGDARGEPEARGVDGGHAERKEGISDRLMTYEPNYEGSPVIAGPPGGRTTAHGEHMYKSRAGHHLAPQMLSSGNNVFEELGQGFALLAFDASEADIGAFADAARALKVPLKVIRDTQAGGREAYEAKLTLVRPDQFVVWAGNNSPADAKALLGKAIGR